MNPIKDFLTKYPAITTGRFTAPLVVEVSKAREAVATQKWGYCSKEEWKTKVRGPVISEEERRIKAAAKKLRANSSD